MTAATLTAYPSTDYVAVQQLLTSASDGVRVQAQEIAEEGVAAVAESDRFQSGKQAALLLVGLGGKRTGSIADHVSSGAVPGDTCGDILPEGGKLANPFQIAGFVVQADECVFAAGTGLTLKVPEVSPAT